MVPDREDERLRMVATQLRARGIEDERVLAAMARVPRHLFVPADCARLRLCRRAPAHRPRPDHFPALYRRLYDGSPAARGGAEGPRDRNGVGLSDGRPGGGGRRGLDGGARRGAFRAGQDTCSRPSAMPRIHFRVGDGSAGWPEAAPFDGIIVTAAPPSIPEALEEPAGSGRPDDRSRRPGNSGARAGRARGRFFQRTRADRGPVRAARGARDARDRGVMKRRK